MAKNYNANLQEHNLYLVNILDTINSLPEAGGGGGTELPTLTNEGSAADLLSGKQLIDSNGNVVEGTIPTKTASNLTVNGATVTVPEGYYSANATKSVSTATQATPTVSIDSAGKITASATQTAGYVTAGTKSATKQLTTQAAKTVTPTKSSQTVVAKNVYTTGAVTVGAIPATYITTTDATATANDILKSKTAYANGKKITGTIETFDGPYTCNATGNTTLHTAGKYCEGDILVKVPEGDGGTTPKVSGLTVITGDDVTEIPNDAFADCPITQLIISDSVTHIGDNACCWAFSLESVSMGNGVQSIGSYAFSNCNILNDIILSENLLSIGVCCFASCATLSTIVIPDSVVTIGEFAFGATNITDITIGSGISKIEYAAFATDSAITNLKIKALIPPVLEDSYCFHFNLGEVNEVFSPKIFVPYASLNQYKNATSWSEYADYMIGFGEGLSYFCAEVRTIAQSQNRLYFTFEEGMTWRQFVNSDYNVNNEFALGGLNGDNLMWQKTGFPISCFDDVNVDSIIEPESFIYCTNDTGLEM